MTNDTNRSDAATRRELLEDILDNGAAYSFPQLLRLLEGRLRDEADASLRIRPALSMELPRSAVKVVQRDGDRLEILTTFLGLYGASSPLPAFYTQELIEAAQEDRTSAQTLLDIIHQHLYQLHTTAERRKRPLEAAVERGEPRFIDLMRSLAGLRDSSVRRRLPSARKMLRYVSLLGARRSAEGLRTLLSDALNGVPVSVEQCVPRMVRIPAASRVRLGEQSHALGRNTVIGTHVHDRTGKLRIHIGPLQRDRFRRLINDSEQWHWLVSTIRFYLTTPLECELELELEPGAGASAVLGDPELGTLGSSAWLFSGTPGALRATLRLN